MLVQEHIKQYGVDSLTLAPYFIKVKKYDNGLVILNYDQIESPKFDPICMECRALILDANNDYKVISRSFKRFFNYGEDKIPTPDLSKAVILEKIDGSLMPVYYHEDKWQPHTRSMAMAEGDTALGNTFCGIFKRTFDITKLDWAPKNWVFVFEMVSPETRVVKPYEEGVYLLTIIDRETGHEFSTEFVDQAAKVELGVKRSIRYPLKDWDDLIKASKELPPLDEGYVCLWESGTGQDNYRLKVKNPAYLAIAHMRNNGCLSKKRIMYLIMKNDHEEYLSYFPEDKPVFTIYINIWNEIRDNVNKVFKDAPTTSQKDFAIYVQDKLPEYYHLTFSLRKGKTWEDIVVDLLSKEQSMNMIERIVESLEKKT